MFVEKYAHLYFIFSASRVNTGRLLHLRRLLIDFPTCDETAGHSCWYGNHIVHSCAILRAVRLVSQET